ncbi:hypothetical protein CKW00_11655 [Salimicrobium humidisoli]|uniref:Uncharacterized protein n=1 Tax=Salimicrobium humidisoli TaxID=2029857 RepID=A0ABX4HPD4_9BACI|nr:hypothetical protein CKW00_11655 [Salimicrobium humidisoli]
MIQLQLPEAHVLSSTLIFGERPPKSKPPAYASASTRKFPLFMIQLRHSEVRKISWPPCFGPEHPKPGVPAYLRTSKRMAPLFFVIDILY